MNNMNNEKTAICAIIKDEHPYLKEWIDHHLALGIDYIYLYEDDGETHEEICKEYDNVFLTAIKDFVTYEHWCQKQTDVYNKFIETYKDTIDYVFFIDLDEFVMFDDGQNIQSLINICNNLGGGVLLAWKMYGAEGLINKPNTKVIETYITQSPCVFSQEEMYNKWMYKTFCRLDKGPIINFHAHDVAKTIVPWGHPNIYEVCWINHYITKSWEEWCEKLFVRKQNIPIRTLDEFFRYNPDMIDLKDQLYEFSKNYMDGPEPDLFSEHNRRAEEHKDEIHQAVMKKYNL